MSFLQSLVPKGILSDSEVVTIARDAEKAKGGVDEVLLGRGHSREEIAEWKHDYFDLDERPLAGMKIPSEVLKYIPEESARHYQILPLGVEEGVLQVGIVDPDRIEAKEAIRFIAAKIGLPYRLSLITLPDFNEASTQYANLTGEVTQALSELKGAEDMEASVNAAVAAGIAGSGASEHEHVEQHGGETKIVEDAPVTKIVAVILKHAVEGGASDVHVEHTGEKIRVRFRVDGVMYTSLILPANVHSAVVARIKILSQLKLDEKRKPQDGRFSVLMEGKKIDFRVSTFPAYYGEKVVLRILDSSRGVRALSQMALAPWQLKIIRDAIATPYGLILVTGPTGSGKSTTLYAMLNELDREKHNVISLEDPVEFNIAGVSQSQVRPEIGYTFANGLRSILRQDPDIIMVGEIRDKETAQLAVQAALTGHLVFSTLHTNNAAGVIPRLIDMEVDPYLIAPTLIMAMGQRLLRTLCPDGKKEIPLSESMRLMIEKQFSDLPEAFRKELIIPDHVYEAQASPTCPAGTKGRTGVFEFMQMDRDLERVVLTNPVEQAVYEAARAKGMHTMKDDALLKAFSGMIPFEEVNNIV
jgi:type IV pilus assembly protein PilB